MRVAVGQADPREFRRPTADIEQQRTAPVTGQQRRAEFQREFGFLTAGDDAKVEAGFLLHPAQESGAVGCSPAGLGGDGANTAHGSARQAGGTGLQGADRAVHRAFVQHAGGVQTLA